MSCLLLVKHALPDIRPNVPAREWRLGERGRAQSARLAEALRPYSPGVVISSDEPKAAETGRIVAEALGLPYRAAPGLNEHDVTGEPYLDDPAAFEAAVKSLFGVPERRVFGSESANEALRRFSGAVETALEPYPEENVVLVAHGRVNTLFVAAHNDVEPFAFWQSWRLGTFTVLSRPEYGLLEPPQLPTSKAGCSPD